MLTLHKVMRVKKRGLVAAAIAACLLLAAAIFLLSSRNRYVKYTDTFFDTFDTAVTVVAYTRSEDEFDDYFGQIHRRFVELHRLYDIYNKYEGLNNARTVNLSAGLAPVAVDSDLFDLLLFCKEWYAKTGGKTNIAMGSVLKIWHDYREQALADPEAAALPPEDLLREAAAHTDIDNLVVDRIAGTVFLEDPMMSLDLGAVAKGYATELVAKEMEAKGLISAVISSGGNVRTIGKPLDGVRERWGTGIQDPAQSIFSDDENLLDVVFVNDSSVVSSGDYQRYYIVDDILVHHIIDPETLMPANYHHSVTVVTPDSGFADFMSTTLFILPLEEGMELAGEVGVDAIWVTADGSIHMTEGFKYIARSQGATGSKAR